LVSGAFNPGLTPAESDNIRWLGRTPPPCRPDLGCVAPQGRRNVLLSRSASIDQLAHYLSEVFGLPVRDATNLTGRYDFNLAWPLERARADRKGLPSNEVLKKVLDEQLGLKLLAANDPVERVVVDRIAELTNVPQSTPVAGVDPPAIILRNPVVSVARDAA